MPSSLLFIMVGSSLGARMGEHCEYVDLCAVGTKEESTCRVGQKFLLKGQKESGVRRQFLITNSTNMVAFLTRGEKAVECGQSLLDITTALSCKDVEGVSELLLNVPSSKIRKGGRRSERRKRKKGWASRRPKKRAAVRGRHCDYIHLCGIGREEEGPGCRPGDKFLVEGEQGVRRQFLMAPGSNIVIFLSRGKKVTSCYGQGWSILTDISQQVTCKPVAGVESLSVETGLAISTTTATSIPDLPYTPPLVCPCGPPYNNTWNPSMGRCVVKIESTHDSHSVICNGETTKVPCGADIKANGDLYSHPLCTSNGYLTVGDLTWQCSDLTVPAAQDCSLTPR